MLGRWDVGTLGRGDVGTWGRGDVGMLGRGDVGMFGLEIRVAPDDLCLKCTARSSPGTL